MPKLHPRIAQSHRQWTLYRWGWTLATPSRTSVTITPENWMSLLPLLSCSIYVTPLASKSVEPGSHPCTLVAGVSGKVNFYLVELWNNNMGNSPDGKVISGSKHPKKLTKVHYTLLLCSFLKSITHKWIICTVQYFWPLLATQLTTDGLTHQVNTRQHKDCLGWHPRNLNSKKEETGGLFCPDIFSSRGRMLLSHLLEGGDHIWHESPLKCPPSASGSWRNS